MTDTPEGLAQGLVSSDDSRLLNEQRRDRMNQLRHKKLRWANLALLVAFVFAYTRIFVDPNSVVNIFDFLSLGIVAALVLATFMAFRNAHDGAFARTAQYRLITWSILVCCAIGFTGAVGKIIILLAR